MARFILSTEQVNRYGFRVLSAGIKLDNFKANPVMFYVHDRSKLPIGTWKDIRIEKNGNLTAEPEFDENDDFALQIKDKVDQGILKAASLNFNVISLSEDPKDLVKGQKYPTVTECEPWEASIVDIPGNPGCMRLSYRGIELGGDLSLSIHTIMQPIKSVNNMKEIALALGLKEDATDKEILAALTKALSAKTETPAAAQIPAAVAASEDMANSLVTLGKAKGVINETNEATFKALALKDFDNTLKLLNATPAAAAGTDAPTAGKTESLAGALKKLAGQQQPEGAKTGISADRLSWSHRDWEKKDPKGLMKLSAETRQELFEAEYKS
jgi:hypothetical protein